MTEISTKAKFKLGTTLYSFAPEWAAGYYDLESMLARVKEFEIGPGLEILASQTVRTFPNTSPDFINNFRNLCDKYELEPSAYGTNLDMGRNRKKEMDYDEEFEFVIGQVEAGAAMGFPVIKLQNARRGLLEKLLPHAEKLNVKLGYEIHAPEGPNSPKIMEIRETYDALDSELLGFVPDFSSTMHSMGRTMLQTLSKKGLDEAALTKIQEVWATDASGHDRINTFIAYLESRDIDPGSLGPFARMSFSMNGHVAPEEWNDIMHQVVHIHGKFFDMNPDGQVDAIDYPKHIRIFAEGGFSGYISSEWEGHAFADMGEVDPFEEIRLQHELMKKYM
jgi:sugar phosphate isomerase/epimerase